MMRCAVLVVCVVAAVQAKPNQDKDVIHMKHRTEVDQVS